MNEHFFTERGIYFRQNTFRNDRPTLVFIHGLSGSSSAWIAYEKRFADTCNILALDLRGHGKSERPLGRGSYAMDLFASDIEALLRYLEIRDCILISHSFGSLIALSFLDKHQDLVRGVVLLSPQYSVNMMLAARLVRPFIRALNFILPVPKSKRVGDHVDYSKYPNGGDWNIPRSIADVKNTGLRIYLYCVEQTYSFNGEDVLEKICVPVLIIHGRNDTIFPVKYAKIIQSKIKGSEISIIEDTDHILVLNNFPEVSTRIERFIIKLTSRP